MPDCPNCGCRFVDPHARDPKPPLRTILERIAPGDERLVRSGASRWYMHKLADRFPDLVFRQERVSLIGGRDGRWDIYAARPALVSP
jgi:hypothetical protein